MSVWGIILAAGLGIRMGSPKAFLPLNEKPMLLYSLDAFQKTSLVDGIIVVSRDGDRKQIEAMAASYSISKLISIVPGGKERQDSVKQGIIALPKDASVVAVHDAARPLITPELITSVIQMAKEKGSSLLAVPMKDTVKVAKNKEIEKTLNREALWAAQTPQAFQVDLFKKALEKASQENFYGTDCTSLIEKLGIPTYIVEGSNENIKVTTPADVAMAEALLRKRDERVLHQ